MREIKYLGFFDFQDSKIKRNYVTSAVNKMETNYMSLIRSGYDVKIVSMSQVVEPVFIFYRGSTTERFKGLKLKTFFSWGGRNPMISKIRSVWHVAAMLSYLLLNTRRDDVVLVYHSLGFFNIVNIAHRLRKFKLIMEVNEIYQDVDKPKYKMNSSTEFKIFGEADAFLFSTELLNERLNPKGKPFAVNYGTYQVIEQRVDRFDDGKIHVVYAGTFDPRKGGAATAVAAAAHLPENYHIHILGFGTKADVENMKETVAKINSDSKSTVTYDGLKTGDEFIDFLQKCHIGLSTQNPTADFNATSFPSKILTYMANGLSVVSIDIPAISGSAVGKQITYYEEQKPERIAEAITMCPIENNNREVITRLSVEFTRDLGLMVSSLYAETETSPKILKQDNNMKRFCKWIRNIGGAKRLNINTVTALDADCHNSFDMNPNLSVVIPTKNREYYCIKCIEHLLSLKLPSTELIVQDNSDTDELENLLTETGIIRRIKYEHVRVLLSFVDNFNRAVEKCEGKYICMIGDDDSLLPNISKVLDKAIELDADAVVPELLTYFWPTDAPIRPEWKDGYLASLPFKKDILKKVDVSVVYRRLIDNCFQDYQMLKVPRIYHGLVKRECVEKIRNRTGHYFGGLTPDMYMSVALCYTVKNFYHYSRPFTISGICPKSGSSDSATGRHTGSLKDAPHFRGHDTYEWIDRIPAIYTVETIWAETGMQAVKGMHDTESFDLFNSQRFLSVLSKKYPQFQEELSTFATANDLSIKNIKSHYRKLHTLASKIKKVLTGNYARKFYAVNDLFSATDIIVNKIKIN